MDLSGLTWRKSSHSGSNGGTACVEIAFTADWRTSTYSGSNGGTECVEVAVRPGATAVRDSKNPDGPALAFPAHGWASFLTTISG